MSRSLGIPVKLLHEASGHVVTVELKSGELYRGSMVECEDNWNCQLENITYTAKVSSEYWFMCFCFLFCDALFTCSDLGFHRFTMKKLIGFLLVLQKPVSDVVRF